MKARKIKPEASTPITRPRCTRRVRRGLYELVALLQNEYGLTLAAMRGHVRQAHGARRERELMAAVRWVEDLEAHRRGRDAKPGESKRPLVAPPPPAI